MRVFGVPISREPSPRTVFQARRGGRRAQRRCSVDKDRIEGTAKKYEGKLTGDESREAEGRLQEKRSEAKGAPRRMWEDLKDKAGKAYNEREERKEREQARR
jgi:uncharacterized protein YjbJ (UPF0337 family)